MTVFVNTNAQTTATTTDGRKVILNNDGTWKDDEPKSSTTKTFECPDLIESTTDKVTGDVTTGVKESIVVSKDGKNGLGLYAFKARTGIILIVTAISADAGGCIEDNGKMNILFRDGTRLELINQGKFNCDAKFTLFFGGVAGHKKELEMFRTRGIETMRVWTSKSYVEEDFSEESSKTLMKSIDCLSLK